MSGRKSGKKVSPVKKQPKKRKRQCKSQEDNGKNVSTSQSCEQTLNTNMNTNMTSQNMNASNTTSNMQGMQGTFMPMQNNPSSMQGQMSAPMMFSYSPPPQPNTNMGSQMNRNSNFRPDWAIEILQSMSDMKKELCKLGSMEKTLNNINRKVETLETKVNQVEQVAKSCEKSCEFLNSIYEGQKKELTDAKSSITSLKKQCSDLEKRATECESQKGRVQDKLNGLESRSMRENLLFLGIDETQNEDCAEKVKQFCEDELQMAQDTVSEIEFDRAHRIGKVKVGSVRPIVVKFHRYKDREAVRSQAACVGQRLRERHFTVKPQLPFEVMEKRKPLYSVFEAGQAKGNRCKFVLDKLYVNGRPYEAPTPSYTPNSTGNP